MQSILMQELAGLYRGADKSLARPTSLYNLFDGETISFDASLVLYIYIYI
jgi:hypothetical protein